MATKTAPMAQFFIEINGVDLDQAVMRNLDDALIEEDLQQSTMFSLCFNDPKLDLLDGELLDREGRHSHGRRDQHVDVAEEVLEGAEHAGLFGMRGRGVAQGHLQALLDIGRNHVLIVFDIRRYDARMLEFAVSAKERGARIVLITDQWISPIARIAVHSLPLRIEAPSSWDSNIVPMFVAEALVAAVVNASWPETQARINQLETLSEPARRGK